MMHFQWIVSAMLSVIDLGVVITTSDIDCNPLKPFGPKNCGHLCRHRIGCSGYLYSPLDLSCRLITGKNNTGQLSLRGTYYLKVYKDKQRLVAKRNLTCLRNSKIFHTRRNILKCRKRIFESQLKPSGRMKYTRLLILPDSSNFYQGRQLYLHNNSIVSYPHINIQKTIAVAYIFTKRKVLISTKYPHELSIAALDSTDTTIIKRGNLINGIGVDEENHLVFLAMYFSEEIHVMTIEGKNSTQITRTNGIPGQIVADPQKQVIYVAVYSKGISKYTYKGQPLETVYKGYVSLSLFSNLDRNVLYYATYPQNLQLSFYKIFLSNLTSYGIPTQFKPYRTHFYIYSNKMYVTPAEKAKRNMLHVLNDSGKEITVIDTGYGADLAGLIMCAIP